MISKKLIFAFILLYIGILPQTFAAVFTFGFPSEGSKTKFPKIDIVINGKQSYCKIYGSSRSTDEAIKAIGQEVIPFDRHEIIKEDYGEVVYLYNENSYPRVKISLEDEIDPFLPCFNIFVIRFYDDNLDVTDYMGSMFANGFAEALGAYGADNKEETTIETGDILATFKQYPEKWRGNKEDNINYFMFNRLKNYLKGNRIESPNSNSYNTYQSHNYKNTFGIKHIPRPWGVSFGYVNKQYIYSVKPKKGGPQESAKFKYDNWCEEDKMMHGFQLGVVYQPYFGYGQGLITGLFWQYFMGTAPVEDDPSDDEHNLMIPLLYQFRLPLGENTSIYASSGIEMVCGLSHKISWGDGEDINLGFGVNNEYDLVFPKKVQFYVPLGVGFQYKAMQLEFRYSWGITDNKQMYEGINEEYNNTFKGRTMEAAMQIVF